ncbi:MAG: PD-(D/E)XK nuclease family protein [Candidatus Solibacter usitatus]|nr:PD-(D/E)XK nuclease family protein [Candidatus Solibacter usitatus]
MRLLLGEPGSGKTTRILAAVRAHLQSSRPSFRLIVPTATMAGHLRNTLAREGLAVRPSAISTLAAFIGEILPEARLASPTGLTLLVQSILEARSPRAFASLAASPGFPSALASAIEDLASAGCDALQWDALRSLHIQSGPHMAAFGLVYDALERELNARGLLLRSAQLAAAAASLRRAPPPPLRDIFFDGFFSFTLGELELIRALKPHSNLTVALPEWPGAEPSRQALRALGLHEERLHPVRSQPGLTFTAAPSRHREAEDIALRILELHAAGHPWRDIGVVLRSAEPYAPLLETTFARLGIPVRSYFARPLAAHPVIRFFSLLIDALLSGWECGRAAAALRSPLCAAATDHLDFAVREALPAQGLDTLRRIAATLPGAPPLLAAIDQFDDLTPWTDETLPPSDWAARLSTLSRFIAPPDPQAPVDPEALRVLRARSAALAGFADSLSSLAALLGGEPLALDTFWRHAQDALRDSSLRVPDSRRDTVHLLDVYEARQWELPIVFLCGLLEGDFPRAAQPDPVLGEETRLRLRSSGIPVKTRPEREAEEDFLFQFALHRATTNLFLSWPLHDPKGRPTLRSFALDRFALTPWAARALRVSPSAPVPPALRPTLHSEPVLQHVRELHRTHRPTSLEAFLQCPFQFFASRTLGLKEPPALPAERLDLLALGALVHAVIAEWHRTPGPIDNIFERHWRRLLARLRVPPSHRVEVSRLLILRSLDFYSRDPKLRPGWTTSVERELDLDLDGVLIRGRADRIDTSPAGEAVVYDFKFTSASGLAKRYRKQEAGLLVQGGIYLAALAASGATPAGFYLTSVRGGASWKGTEDPAQVHAGIDTALAAARDAILRISAGDISVRPADPDACDYCAFLDACRIQSEVAATTEEASA